MADQATLSLAIPAAVAGLAYLNARLSIWYDLILLRSVVPATLKSYYRQYFDRLNQFYVLEAYAQSSRYANKPFILFEDRSYTFRQVYDLVLKYGTWFRTTKGVKPRDVVALDYMNSDTFVFCMLGLWSIGAKPALINYNLTGHALAHCVKAARTKLMIVDPAVAHNVTDEVRGEIPGVRIEIFTPEAEGEVLSTEGVRAPDEDRAEQLLPDMAMLIYTSGTTGLPKAAIVSWAKCTIGGGFTGRVLSFGEKDVFYTCMPLYHSSACILGFLNTLESGGTFAIGRKFSTKTFWADVRKHDATIIQYVGETCRYLLSAPPSEHDKNHKVRIAFGNGLRPDVWEQFKTRFNIPTVLEFYAATEGTLGTWNISSNDFARGAVGRNGFVYALLVGRNMAVVEVDFETDSPRRDPNKESFCVRVKPGEPGEMLFALPADKIASRFQGYYNNPSATDSKIMRDVFRKGDAWFRTGDVVRWDGEGRTYFADRIGDTFRWKSENVSTAEVGEAVGHHPAVKEANVYGVELPHHDGRAGCAALILDGEPSPSLLESLAKHAKQVLPKYAMPIFLRVVKGGMITTGTNKQQKHHLRVEGVDPEKTGSDGLFWLKGDSYVPFGPNEWSELQGGRVRL